MTRTEMLAYFHRTWTWQSRHARIWNYAKFLAF